MLPHKAPTNIRFCSHQQRAGGLLRCQLCDTVRVTNRGPEDDDVEFMDVNSELLEQFTSQLLGSFALKISVLLDFLPQTVRKCVQEGLSRE